MQLRTSGSERLKALVRLATANLQSVTLEGWGSCRHKRMAALLDAHAQITGIMQSHVLRRNQALGCWQAPTKKEDSD